MNISELAVKAGFDVDEGRFPFEATEDKYIGTERVLEDFAELIRDEARAQPVQEPVACVNGCDTSNGKCVDCPDAAPVDAKAIRAEALAEIEVEPPVIIIREQEPQRRSPPPPPLPPPQRDIRGRKWQRRIKFCYTCCAACHSEHSNKITAFFHWLWIRARGIE